MPSLLNRLLSRNTADLLARDALVSGFTFALGLGLMWIFVEFWGVDELVSAAGSFVAANSLHYVFARTWVFRGTTRGLAQGYGYFLVNAGVGLVIMLLLFAACMRWTSMHYVVARALASVVAGAIIFVLNAALNFRRV